MAQQDTSHMTSRVEGWLEREVFQPIEDFQDPKQEWRRLFSELFGTFFLVLVAAGGGMMGQAFPGTISRTAFCGHGGTAAEGLWACAVTIATSVRISKAAARIFDMQVRPRGCRTPP